MDQWNNVELSSIHKKPTHKQQSDDTKEFICETNSVASNSTQESNMKTNEVLQPGSDIKPKVNIELVESLLHRLYGITTISIKELISYDDRNYLIQEDRNVKNPLITTHWPHGYVLKILNALDSKKTDFVGAQNELMLYLAQEGILCPKPIANVNGAFFTVEQLNGTDHVVRLLQFIPGKIFHEVEKSRYLLYQSGVYLAKIDQALKNFHHAAYETHKTVWMLQSVPQLKDFLYVLQDHARKGMVEEIVEAFETKVLSRLNNFEQQIIHGDYNEQNIIVNLPTSSSQSTNGGGGGGDDEYRVAGIIDFGDTNKSPVIFEIGIALAYMLLQAKSLENGGIFLAGYTSVRPIKAEERQFLKYCVAARLAQSLVMGAYTYSLDPTNEYVLVTQEEGWKIIEQLWLESFAGIDEIWQSVADQYLRQSLK